jgi:hypothetical protein
MGEEHFEHSVMDLSIGCTECCVQRRFSGIWPRLVYISTLLDQILAQMRMSVESSRAEAVVVPQRLERFSVGEQELHCADIAVIGAPLKERHAVFVCRSRRVTRGYVIEHQVCAPVGNLLEYIFAHFANV